MGVVKKLYMISLELATLLILLSLPELVELKKKIKLEYPEPFPSEDSNIYRILEKKLKLFDMRVNIGNDQFKGIYQNRIKHHENDYNEVFVRAYNFGVKKILYSAGTLIDSNKAIDIALDNKWHYASVAFNPIYAHHAYNEYADWQMVRMPFSQHKSYESNRVMRDYFNDQITYTTERY